jgi:hypothetical protein
MTQAAAPATGSEIKDKLNGPEFVFATPPAQRKPATDAPTPPVFAHAGSVSIEIPSRVKPALRYTAAAVALLALFGAWHFSRQAQQHDAPPVSAHLPLSADRDLTPPAAPASVPPAPSVERIEATFAAVNVNRQALQSLNDGQKRQEEALKKMGHDVAELIDGFKQMQARQAAAPASAVSAKPRQAKARPSAPKTTAELLSVDIWDGRPSAVVGTTDPGDRRVIYLHEGDQHKGITLKRADHAAQQAVVDVGGRNIVLSREHGQP